MKESRIDLLNIGLIFVSLIAAYRIPFELFLFSYAVLGPLHYLTEVQWLWERSFFIPKPASLALGLAVPALLISIPQLFLPIPEVHDFLMANLWGSSRLMIVTCGVLFLTFLFAGYLVWIRREGLPIPFLMILALCAAGIFWNPEGGLMMVGVFLPTLIHVYIFTMLFVLFGALKRNSFTGYLNAIVLLTVPFIILISPINLAAYLPSEEIKNTFVGSGFHSITYVISKWLGTTTDNFYLLSKANIKIQIFIAFAYTYHYLNWFSKTRTIGWQKTLKGKRGLVILGLWILSVALYAYDYKVGFTALFALSMLHVFMEFPLNWTSIQGIMGMAKGVASNQISGPASPAKTGK